MYRKHTGFSSKTAGPNLVTTLRRAQQEQVNLWATSGNLPHHLRNSSGRAESWSSAIDLFKVSHKEPHVSLYRFTWSFCTTSHNFKQRSFSDWNRLDNPPGPRLELPLNCAAVNVCRLRSSTLFTFRVRKAESNRHARAPHLTAPCSTIVTFCFFSVAHTYNCSSRNKMIVSLQMHTTRQFSYSEDLHTFRCCCVHVTFSQKLKATQNTHHKSLPELSWTYPLNPGEHFQTFVLRVIKSTLVDDDNVLNTNPNKMASADCQWAADSRTGIIAQLEEERSSSWSCFNLLHMYRRWMWRAARENTQIGSPACVEKPDLFSSNLILRECPPRKMKKYPGGTDAPVAILFHLMWKHTCLELPDSVVYLTSHIPRYLKYTNQIQHFHLRCLKNCTNSTSSDRPLAEVTIDRKSPDAKVSAASFENMDNPRWVAVEASSKYQNTQKDFKAKEQHAAATINEHAEIILLSGSRNPTRILKCAFGISRKWNAPAHWLCMPSDRWHSNTLVLFNFPSHVRLRLSDSKRGKIPGIDGGLLGSARSPRKVANRRPCSFHSTSHLFTNTLNFHCSGVPEPIWSNDKIDQMSISCAQCFGLRKHTNSTLLNLTELIRIRHVIVLAARGPASRLVFSCTHWWRGSVAATCCRKVNQVNVWKQHNINIHYPAPC